MPQPPATVHRLRPRNPRQAAVLQEALDLGGWSDATREELNRRLTVRLEPAGDPWRFTMLASRPETLAAFLREIAEGPRGFSTLRVWLALAPYVRRDTGEVLCSQRTLGRTASASIGDVQRAMARLVEMGALLREGRGRYRVHPGLMWKGELEKRGRMEAAVPPAKLRLVEREPAK